ncbi:hypothetical protein K402DRAFT_422385 [Aulographum hederae CBS 113979]|uniref:Calcium channel YVC1-like C-terminal transmembrane domain-containing protein n=1 Tax=Aulographum hederae CBS 113979 TaxID=1176131 RepID=A0A6G1GWF5_9PEZI|nr:hypothetical protein K402DRAFT_422385 [Aulographum hederae CBS 113979]
MTRGSTNNLFSNPDSAASPRADAFQSDMVGSVKWYDVPPLAPDVDDDEPLASLIQKFSLYFLEAIQTPNTYEQLRTIPHGRCLTPLIKYLSEEVHNRNVVCALIALKGHFAALESDDDRGVNETRGFACEIVAWRFVSNLSRRETIHQLLYELPSSSIDSDSPPDAEAGNLYQESNGTGNHSTASVNERTPLRPNTSDDPETPRPSRTSSYFGTTVYGDLSQHPDSSGDFASSFENLNALEIAAVSGAKKFLSQRVVQKVIESIWRGEIVFWETLDVDSVKEAKFYNEKRADPFCRLRVPRYLKAYEVLFFALFLTLYYIVLVQRVFHAVTPAEILLYVWIAGFAYDEFAEFRDAGQAFYATDFWTIWDIGIVATGIAFFISRLVGLIKEDDMIIDTSFDILALEALFLVPRICSLLSLNPYFGTLIPCLKEMTKDFLKFLSLVVILYLGFLTTFTLLARNKFTLSEMSWILVKVFFGSSYLGFDVAKEISPILGPPVMILDHAREEYLYTYSVYVLEASTSNRLTYYLPPLNLIVLLFRPLRLVVSSESLRKARIVVLKVTHSPVMVAIWLYEAAYASLEHNRSGRTSLMSVMSRPDSSASMKRPTLKSSLNSPRPLAAATRVQASLDGRARSRPATAVPSHAANTSSRPLSEDLESLVLKLSSQVEQLTAMVAEQQGDHQPQPDQTLDQ